MAPNRGVMGHGTRDLIRRQLDWMDSTAPGMIFEFALFPIHREFASSEHAEGRIEGQQSPAASQTKQPQAHPPTHTANQTDTPRLLVTIKRHPPQRATKATGAPEQQENKIVEGSGKAPAANNTGTALQGTQGRRRDDATPHLDRCIRVQPPGGIREPEPYAIPVPWLEESDSSLPDAWDEADGDGNFPELATDNGTGEETETEISEKSEASDAAETTEGRRIDHTT